MMGLLCRQTTAPIKTYLEAVSGRACMPGSMWKHGGMSEGFLSGRMLIAMPGIDDPRFERALILLCAHDRDHAMGLTVNRPIDGLFTPELLRRLGVTPDYPMEDRLVLFGGPVERERGFVLHTDDYRGEGISQVVGKGLA